MINILKFLDEYNKNHKLLNKTAVLDSEDYRL